MFSNLYERKYPLSALLFGKEDTRTCQSLNFLKLASELPIPLTEEFPLRFRMYIFIHSLTYGMTTQKQNP